MVLRFVRAALGRTRRLGRSLLNSVKNFEVGSIPSKVGRLATFDVVSGTIMSSIVGLAVMYFAYGWVTDVYL